MHLDPGTIQAFLDDELDEAVRARTAHHLESCATCAQAVLQQREAWSEEQEWLAGVDEPRPAVGLEAIRIRAKGPSRSRTGVRYWRWAAGLIFTAATASAAWALPQSPLRAWLDRSGASSPAPLADVRGVSVPVAGPVDLRFNRIGPGARVLLVGAERSDPIVIETANPSLSFALGPDGVDVDLAGLGALVTVRVPEDARGIRIHVGGDLRWDLPGGRAPSSAVTTLDLGPRSSNGADSPR